MSEKCFNGVDIVPAKLCMHFEFGIQGRGWAGAREEYIILY